jgi:hypothetical protein
MIVLFLSGVFISTASAQNWYKGNLHTHSLWSDGDNFPEMIADWYKSNGYNFLAVTEHNRLQEGENWRVVPGGFLTADVLNKYKLKFGEKYVEVKKEENGDTKVRLKTLAEYREQYEEAGRFLLINGEEITSSYNGRPLHVNGINTKEVVPRQHGNDIPEVLQHAVNTTLQQRKRTGQKMFPILNHPNFWKTYTASDIMKVQNVRFFEVQNGLLQTGSYGDHNHDSTEVMWDKVNLELIRQGRPLLFGVGVDDSHNYHRFGPEFHNPGRAWVMVNASKLEPETLVDAMEAGHFYASTGIVLKDLSFTNKSISIKVESETDVVYTIQFIGVRKGNERSAVLKQVTGNEASYTLTDQDIFVRAKITSSKFPKNPHKPGDYETAWTQPVSPVAFPYRAPE